MPGDPVANGVVANLAATVGRLRSAGPVLSRLVREGSLSVVGALYDLRTGEVRLTDASSTDAEK
jgi:carbonic anhydrase